MCHALFCATGSGAFGTDPVVILTMSMHDNAIFIHLRRCQST